MLRFDPPVSSRQNALRAEIVLKTLGRMNEKAPLVQRPYSGIIEKLVAEWADACTQAGGDPNIAPEEAAKVKMVIDTLEAAFEGYVAFPANQWDRVVAFTEALSEEGARNVPTRASDERRLVLNAAWTRRLHHPEDVDSIRLAAEILMERIPVQGSMAKEDQNRGRGGLSTSAQSSQQALPVKPSSDPQWGKG
jgi:hypothetical protein